MNSFISLAERALSFPAQCAREDFSPYPWPKDIRPPFSLRPYQFSDDPNNPQTKPLTGIDLRLDYTGNWTKFKFRSDTVTKSDIYIWMLDEFLILLIDAEVALGLQYLHFIHGCCLRVCDDITDLDAEKSCNLH